MLKRLFRHFNRSDESSWAAHALQAALMVAFFSVFAALFDDPYLIGAGFFFSEGAWFHRELSDFVTQGVEEGWLKATAHLKEDGLNDFVFPHLAGMATALLAFFIV